MNALFQYEYMHMIANRQRRNHITEYVISLSHAIVKSVQISHALMPEAQFTQFLMNLMKK